MLYFNTNKPHSFFFLQNTSCIRKPQVISGGVGGAHPLHPPPRSAPVLVACGMELPSFMQFSGNNLFQGSRYKRCVARNGEKDRGREKGTLLPAPCSQPLPPLVCLLTHFSSYCLHYLNAWNRLPGDGCLKKMVSAHCAVQCINHSLKVKKLVSVTVHLPLYSTVKYSSKSCSPSLTNNSLRVVCHFPHRK